MNNFSKARIRGRKLSAKQKSFFRSICEGKKMQHGGMINRTGYLDGAPTAGNPYNIIPGGDITMEGVSIPIMGTPYKNGKAGKSILMEPGENYKFNADYVHETKGNIYQKGGYSSRELYNFLFEGDDEEGDDSPVTAPTDDKLQVERDDIARQREELAQQRVSFEDDQLYQEGLNAAEAMQQEWTSKRPWDVPSDATGEGMGIQGSNTGGYSSFASRIGKSEGAKTGQLTSLKGSALGRGQLIKSTREGVYKKLGIPREQFGSAEQKYKTDPQFEEQVINTLRGELDKRIPSDIQGSQREYMIAKGWYTGNPFYPDNQVPHPEAGNRMTAGAYAKRFIGIK